MSPKRKEMQVAALCNGTVIDHIPSNQVFKVASLLNLERMPQNITIGNNLESEKMGTKGIIKITDCFLEEAQINKIALIAPNAILNIIKDYEVVEKKRLTLPPIIRGIVKCTNPKCITNNEPMQTRFTVNMNEPMTLECQYCNVKIEQEEVVLK